MKNIYKSLRVPKKNAKPGDLIKAVHKMALKKKSKRMSMSQYERMDRPVDKMMGIKEGSAMDKRADRMAMRELGVKGLMKKKPMKKMKKKKMKSGKMLMYKKVAC